LKSSILKHYVISQGIKVRFGLVNAYLL